MKSEQKPLASVSKPLKTKDLPTVSFWMQNAQTMQNIGEVPQEYASYVCEIIAEFGSSVHGNSKAVVVISVDNAEAIKWLAPRAKAKPVEEGQVFPSAIAASFHMGFTYNDIGIRLAKARREVEQQYKGKAIRLRPSVTVRGVTFQYEEDVPG